MQELRIDFERLRKDLKEYYEGAFFAGGHGAALFDISDIENASYEQLLVIADKLNFNIFDYEIWQRG